MEFRHFERHNRVRTGNRAEGPAVNSPARQGGGLHDAESEVQRTGTPTVSHLRRSSGPGGSKLSKLQHSKGRGRETANLPVHSRSSLKSLTARTLSFLERRERR
jgi:hypothetical protein